MSATAFSKLINRKIVFITVKSYSLLLLFMQFAYVSKSQTPVRPNIAIQLLLNTNGGPHNMADGVMAFYADNFSNEIGNEDSYKWTNPDENLAISCQGKLLSIEGRPTIHGSDTLRLVMWQFRQKSYYLRLEARNFSSSVKAIVKDNYLHKETAVNLSSVTLLPFGVTNDSASFASNRFSVFFKTATPLSISGKLKLEPLSDESISLSVASNPGTGDVINVRMNNMKKGRYTVNLYDARAELVFSGFIINDGNSAPQAVAIDKRMHKGSYNLQLTFGEETISRIVLFE